MEEKPKMTMRQHLSKFVRGVYTYAYLKYFKGMDIGKEVSVARSATMERAYPKSVHIGDYSRVFWDTTTSEGKNNRTPISGIIQLLVVEPLCCLG